MPTTWKVVFHGEFEPEFDGLLEEVQDELLAQAKLLQQFGPQLGRPRADTLNGSRHANMKELRFDVAGGVWRVAFAFDPERLFSWLVGTNQVEVKSAFTVSSSKRPMLALTHIW